MKKGRARDFSIKRKQLTHLVSTNKSGEWVREEENNRVLKGTYLTTKFFTSQVEATLVVLV